MRHLTLILGDQLDPQSPALKDFDPAQDILWMAEVRHESTKVWVHKQRITLFLSAMRHYRDARRQEGLTVDYTTLDDAENTHSLGGEVQRAIKRLQPSRVILVQPGEWSVLEQIKSAVEQAGIPLEVRADTHFLCSIESFRHYINGRTQLRLEHFYRMMRQRTGILMEPASGPADKPQPVGGQWNYDHENRESFGKTGPVNVPPGSSFPPDETTREVMEVVERHFSSHPGQLANFNWPVTPADAQVALDDFINHRLNDFGRHQDAMWTGQPWLWHSRLSPAMNLKLIPTRHVLEAAERAWEDGRANLASVEGFVRQILGWREYVRGVYWTQMPGYESQNVLGATQPLPAFYWTGETPMACLRDTIGQTLEHGYAHHIQRLMVTGLYALLLGVEPKQVHEWYLAIYVDAVEWVELPNTIGMSQFSDGGLMASKPYSATGKYINRMSNYCGQCRYNPDQSTGENACPFTTLYWDFLMRHAALLRRNQRMSLQVRNLDRLDESTKTAIQQRAEEIRAGAV